MAFRQFKKNLPTSQALAANQKIRPGKIYNPVLERLAEVVPDELVTHGGPEEAADNEPTNPLASSLIGLAKQRHPKPDAK